MKRFEANFLKLNQILLFALFVCLLPSIGLAQKSGTNKKITYKYNQYVMVTLKDGTEVPARVSSLKSKTQCYVQMIDGTKAGAVSKKFMRPMTADEIAELKRRRNEVARSNEEDSRK
ncbi:MAG: hypothetical protein ABJP45_19255 [Cyclobacteriaceae bacterium]